MYIEFFDNLCFEVVSKKSNNSQYLYREFPNHSESSTSELAFRVELAEKLDAPPGSNKIDNGRFSIINDSIFRHKSSMFLENQYHIDFSENILLLKIPSNIISQRYMLLRMIYPLMRFFLLKANAILLKASCMSSNNGSVLYAGWSGTGKTNMVLNDLCNSRKYVSDTMSIVTSKCITIPLNNSLHIFWRNRKHLHKFISNTPYNTTNISISLLARQFLHLLTFKTKNLSIIVDIPWTSQEKNKTQLSDIIILNNNHSKSYKCYPPDRLANMLYAINHFECFEFNRLLDVFSFTGINVFKNYWKDFWLTLNTLITNLYAEL